MAAVALFASIAATRADGWRQALPGWRYEWPRDHRAHREFKTEWWYFTGNVRAADGRRFGYQLTFFRQGVRSPAARGAETSRFVVDDLKFAHFAITDVDGKRFRFSQKLSRGAFGDAGFDSENAIAWIDEWTLALAADGSFELRAGEGATRLALTLTSGKPWAIHGENGMSQKAAGEGRASHYYSGTRMATRGSLTIDGRGVEVTGESWFDHEWATNQLTPEQVGWDWFSLHFDDGSELMLYRMRARDGGSDPHSSGTFIARDGTTRHLRREDYQLTPTTHWKSGATGGRYPLGWEVAVPSLDLRATITTPVREQELVLKPIAYWEGVVDIAGSHRGHGYMELTGYAGPIVGLSEPGAWKAE